MFSGSSADPSVLFDPAIIVMSGDEEFRVEALMDISKPKHGSFSVDGVVESAGEVSRMVGAALKREAYDIGDGSDLLLRFRSPGDAARLLKALQRLGLMSMLYESVHSDD